MLNQKAIKKARAGAVLQLRAALSRKMNKIQELMDRVEELESEEQPIIVQAEQFLSAGNLLWNHTALLDIAAGIQLLKEFDAAVGKVTATKEASGEIDVLQVSFRDTDQFKRTGIVVEDGADVPIEVILGGPRQLYSVLTEAELNPRFIKVEKVDICVLKISW